MKTNWMHDKSILDKVRIDDLFVKDGLFQVMLSGKGTLRRIEYAE